MRATHSVGSIFGTRSRVQVLRVLQGVRIPLNTSQIASRVKLSWPAVATALDELASMGIVQSNTVGRTWVHQLVRGNVYVQRIVDPVFLAEQEIPELMEEYLRDSFGEHAVSIVLFGSYAREEQDETSDVDVVLVGKDAGEKAALDAEFDARISEFYEKFGATLSPLIYDMSEAAGLWERAPALLASLKEDGVVVSGLRPMEWRSHGQGG